MSIEKAFEIIESHFEEADFSSGIDEDKVERAEALLGLRYPPSYRAFLMRFGSGDIFGEEFYGIISDPQTDSEMTPNGVWGTLNLRETIKFPDSFIVIADSGYGPTYIIDIAEVGEQAESPVYLWDLGGQKEKIADNFGDFLYSTLKEALEEI